MRRYFFSAFLLVSLAYLGANTSWAAPAPSSMIRGTVESFNSRFIFIRQETGQVLQLSVKMFPKDISLRPGQKIRLFVDTAGRGYGIQTQDER